MPDFVSDLKLGDKLGNGAFGEVFRGEDPAHGEVAVKVLRREAYHDDATWPDYKASYGEEAKNLAKARHRNVVQVHHVVEAPDGDSVVICMELCPGGSLEKMYANGPMTLAAVKKVATDVLMGLGAMHARGMLHRDIKPANILLNAKGEAQISDFGLVTDRLLFGYASQQGYLDHIAYEVWHGAGTSPKTDIWALGMTLFRLLHGHAWYKDAPDPRDIIEHGGFADTLKWLPHIPKAWRTALRKMLHDDPASRYQNAGQVLSGIAALPVAPAWTTTVKPDLVSWEQIKGQRTVRVEWERISQRKHRWRAWSEPQGKGHARTLDQSGGVVGQTEAVAGLRDFFDA